MPEVRDWKGPGVLFGDERVRPKSVVDFKVRFFCTTFTKVAEAGDNGSGDLFQRMLKDEEGHADFLDAQLHSITEMGIGTYLAQQLPGEK
jgi:hypothetical protein